MPKQINEAPVYARNIGFDLRQAYDDDGLIIYVGYAYPGAMDSEEKWQIVKYAYDSSSRITHRRYADGNDEYNKEWDKRENYIYEDI